MVTKHRSSESHHVLAVSKLNEELRLKSEELTRAMALLAEVDQIAASKRAKISLAEAVKLQASVENEQEEQQLLQAISEARQRVWDGVQRAVVEEERFKTLAARCNGDGQLVSLIRPCQRAHPSD